VLKAEHCGMRLVAGYVLTDASLYIARSAGLTKGSVMFVLMVNMFAPALPRCPHQRDPCRAHQSASSDEAWCAIPQRAHQVLAADTGHLHTASTAEKSEEQQCCRTGV